MVSHRLERKRELGYLPFDLDFLREIGIEFEVDWDGELSIKFPQDTPQRIISIIDYFKPCIEKRLKSDNKVEQHCFVGGPLNGQRYFKYLRINRPYCRRIQRAEWAVYVVKSHSDPRAWFAGIATSEKNGSELKLKTKGGT